MSSIRPASLDANIGDDNDGATLGEIVKDEAAVSPDEMLADSNMRGSIMELMPLLDSRERDILSLRFGLDGSKELTLEEVGDKFNVTRERIRQLQNSALKKLKRALDKKEKARRMMLDD